MTPQPTHASRGASPDYSPDAQAPGRLDRDVLVAATVGLVDRHGVARFTMRMLGEELGRSAMATYRHVANKEELVALAADAVLAGVEIPGPGSGTPRERLRTLTQNAFVQLAAHPWVSPFLVTRWLTMPNADRVHRAMLAILCEVEPDPERARLGAGAIRAYLIGWLAGPDMARDGCSGGRERGVGGAGPDSGGRGSGAGVGPSPAARAQFDFGLDAMIVGILVSLS